MRVRDLHSVCHCVGIINEEAIVTHVLRKVVTVIGNHNLGVSIFDCGLLFDEILSISFRLIENRLVVVPLSNTKDVFISL